MIPTHVFEETLLLLFAPVRPFLDDPTVTEIMINGPNQVFIERRGQLYLTEVQFPNREALIAGLRNAAQFVGKQVDASRPILEGRLPDGSRIEAVLPPAAPEGPFVSIRRFFRETLTIARLIQLGSLTTEAAETIQAFVTAKLNIVVAGGTGSGKTSMLNAMTAFIPSGERVLIIEDSKEIQPQQLHVLQLEARPPDAHGRGGVSIRDLFRATLRMRPDRLVIGEVRGGEALDLVQAMTSGHGGCLTTLHATYPRDTLSRLETMCMMSDIDMPLVAMRVQIASGINMIVQVGRLRDGTRKVTHITEVLAFDIAASRYVTQDIFVRDFQGMGSDGQIRSTLAPTGVLPMCMDQLREHGVDLPAAVHQAAKEAAASRP